MGATNWDYGVSSFETGNPVSCGCNFRNLWQVINDDLGKWHAAASGLMQDWKQPVPALCKSKIMASWGGICMPASIKPLFLMRCSVLLKAKANLNRGIEVLYCNRLDVHQRPIRKPNLRARSSQRSSRFSAARRVRCDGGIFSHTVAQNPCRAATFG